MRCRDGESGQRKAVFEPITGQDDWKIGNYQVLEFGILRQKGLSAWSSKTRIQPLVGADVFQLVGDKTKFESEKRNISRIYQIESAHFKNPLESVIFNITFP